MNVFVIISQRYRLQPAILWLRSTVVSGMDQKRFHWVRYSQMCGTQFHEGQTSTVHTGFEFRLQRSVQRACWFVTFVCFHDCYNKMSLSILQNRSAKTFCPNVTRASPTLVRTKASASLYPKDSTSADATQDITANIAKTWLMRVTVILAGTRELANCSKKADSGKCLLHLNIYLCHIIVYKSITFFLQILL